MHRNLLVPLLVLLASCGGSPAVERSQTSTVVRPGIETFLTNVPERLPGKRVGLITNHSGIDRERRSDIDLIAAHPQLKLVALLAVPVHSLYLTDDRGPSDTMLKDVDVLVYDLQEVGGGRTWTYVSTMALSMQAARKIPARHGMTVGELAKLFDEKYEIGCDLIVARVEGWRRSQWQDQTGLPWINPSPNLRSLAALTSYTGSVYFEGTTLTEGRGGDRPYETIGAHWLDAARVVQRVARSAAGRVGCGGSAVQAGSGSLPSI